MSQVYKPLPRILEKYFAIHRVQMDRLEICIKNEVLYKCLVSIVYVDEHIEKCLVIHLGLFLELREGANIIETFYIFLILILLSETLSLNQQLCTADTSYIFAENILLIYYI